MNHARREAVRCGNADDKAMWNKIADQWEALARQARDLDSLPKIGAEPKTWV